MFLRYYDERLLGQIANAPASGITARSEWAIVEGTSSKVIGTESQLGPLTAVGDIVDLISFGDGSTSGTDPNRMRKVTGIWMWNNNTGPAVINVRIDNGVTSFQVWYGSIPANGSLAYSPEYGWRVYNASGRVAGGGGYNPGGW